MSGFRPVVYTITPFTTTRVMEQIRVDVCYQNAPVVIVGTGSGLSYASLGPTHHSCEDMAMLRSIPGMSVLAPGDPLEVRACLRAALAHDGPVYIRIGKKGEPVIHKSQPSLRIGQSVVVREGGDACLLAVGVMLPVALEVAAELANKGIQARVVSVISVKPLDVGLLHEVFATCPVVATIEEHGLIGGFGAGVAEWLVDNKLPSSALLRFGTKDKFIHESGELEFAREVMGIDPHSITGALVERLERGAVPAAGER
jgi:transketolase